ncbi:MAG: hypothetical protein HZB76_00690 [Chlamydiae bacterium]|nr:hypothetical protein [Chlamydiota bacterium]
MAVRYPIICIVHKDVSREEFLSMFDKAASDFKEDLGVEKIRKIFGQCNGNISDFCQKLQLWQMDSFNKPCDTKISSQAVEAAIRTWKEILNDGRLSLQCREIVSIKGRTASVIVIDFKK